MQYSVHTNLAGTKCKLLVDMFTHNIGLKLYFLIIKGNHKGYKMLGMKTIKNQLETKMKVMIFL